MFEKQKKILAQIERARAAIRRKHALLKHGKAEAEKIRVETFKPVVEPLQKLVTVTAASKNGHPFVPRLKKEETRDDDDGSSGVNDTLDETVIKRQDTDNGDETLRDEKSIFETADESAEESDVNNYTEVLLGLLRRNEKSALDNTYGVRMLGDAFAIGNAPISFDSRHVKVNETKYRNTVGLLELLFKREPDRSLITTHDLEQYRKIMETSSAYRRGYNPNEPVRRSNSKKFNNYIGPMFDSVSKRKAGGSAAGLFPSPYKIARRDTSFDYVYWDDLNELVNRLRLLVAEERAGNHSHLNEIHSIVEELREAGYIY